MKHHHNNVLGRRNEIPESNRKGSQTRCLELTSLPRTQISQILSSFIEDFDGEVRPSDHWAPNGFQDPKEIRLDEALGFLKSVDQRSELKSWWINPSLTKFRTPAWDLVSTCHIQGQPGLLLIESKAHLGEINSDPCSAKDKQNMTTLRAALDETTEGWNDLLAGLAATEGWKPKQWVRLTPSCHYELACRLAFSLKLARMGIPTALVYLGFLEAWELEEQNCPIFRCHEEWENSVLEKTKQCVPNDLWNHVYDVQGIPLALQIRSLALASTEM